MRYAGRVEYAAERKIRERNTVLYRVAHWPIWIWVFFLAPGPLTFSLFAHGFSRTNFAWLMMVMVGTGVAGWFGQLPGVEPRPYILRFDEDKPNPLYRRICYSFAWNAALNFALMNLSGLTYASATGKWRLKQIYSYGYFPLCLAILALGAAGALPRVRRSTRGEGTERRYFYGTVWAAVIAQVLLMLLWKLLPNAQEASAIKLGAFVTVLVLVGLAAERGLLPRTRPMVPGEVMVAD